MEITRRTAEQPKGSVVAKAESKVLVADNYNRFSLYVTNDGENVVYLALGETAKANEGIRLNAEGGAVVIDDYSGPVSVITAAGESVVTFSEV